MVADSLLVNKLVQARMFCADLIRLNNENTEVWVDTIDPILFTDLGFVLNAVTMPLRILDYPMLLTRSKNGELLEF
jgi:hypothetical protein